MDVRLESLLLLSAAAGCCPGDCYLLAAHLGEGVLLLLNLDFLRLVLLLRVRFHLDLVAHSHFDCCCLLDHWVDHLLLVPLAWCAMVSTAMDMLSHLVLLQHGALVLEVVVEVAEEHLCLVDHLEVVVVPKELCLMERRLELLQYSVCTP